MTAACAGGGRLAEPGVEAGATALQRSDNGATIELAQLDRVLSRSGVIARLGPGARVQPFGIEIASDDGAAAYLGGSSEYLFAAALAGRIEGGERSATGGEVLVWDMLGSPPRLFAFDVDRFLATSSLAIDPVLRDALQAASGRQARATYWGLLAPAQVNLQAPVPPGLEALRRDYLLQPEVIRLRRLAGGDPVALSRAVAERFVESVAARDRTAVTALLHPVLFQQQGGQDWRVLRARFAEALVSGPLPAALAEASVNPLDTAAPAETEGEDTDEQADADAEGIVQLPAVWRVESPAGGYRLELGPFESMIYVTALEAQP